MHESTVHLIIHGHVQGVFFRDSMCREAHRLNIKGWVRNRPDGTVECLLQGSPDNVNRLVKWAHHGPPSARVSKVDRDEQAGGHYTAFEILY